MSELGDQLFHEILMARQRVYAVGQPTPLQELEIPGIPARVFCKREDLGPIKAYKWRGAYNRMALLSKDELERGVVAASAGNHAQGVAIGAKVLGTRATIFMPRSTPGMKQQAVANYGGDAVDIRLVGDSYDEAAAAAKDLAALEGQTFIHPYDDVQVMGGQGTLADEIVMSGDGPFTHVFLQIGGGGMAAATACWLKRHFPGIKTIGVEGVDQASMKAAVAAGQPVELDYVDVFCDGTAVRKAGDLTFQICNEFIDEFVTVTNDEVCNSTRLLWEANRAIPEPAGALGLAAALNYSDQLTENDRVLVILCGANMDFSQLAFIARHGGSGPNSRRYVRIPLSEERGSLVQLLRGLPKNMNIVDVQHGKTGKSKSYPVIGLTGSAEDFTEMEAYFAQMGINHQDVTRSEDVDFRIINYSPDLFTHPLFVHIEFPERPGAFLAFMEQVRDRANLCYFNYAYSGERVGRALVGMEFESAEDRASVHAQLKNFVNASIRAYREVSPSALERILG
ncbi:pyridoxal-phosphate dependent enzyme [Sulfuriroseicoccus oceanibius]|uniref:threonine ammonia-lyase n=1 Tax=Sulfuriroseicoccus oceanibius TaxID=2707525 RepID=A0A6B3LDR9_9BACT|nr:pyridoxal-phosphate dependent enzyme [Sulfuriroseicoccus oceanibius]QQL45729.1 pyridoxal-phosphate dependent enzyme [Sulfuriroseicoccus oceanibius]